MTEVIQRELMADSGVREDLRDKLAALLKDDLDFHGKISGYGSHNYHSFPAKFPPQLPRKFIHALTNPGDVVLDPMMGSGTTVVEAFLAGRQAVGTDIDPLAVLMSKVKVTPANIVDMADFGSHVSREAALTLRDRRQRAEEALANRWDSKTQQFVNYWFAPETQLELVALADQIRKVSDPDARAFLALALSSIIITKSGGVSLALDLGHTRPHKAKCVFKKNGDRVIGGDTCALPPDKGRLMSKTIVSAVEEFGRRVHKNLNGLPESGPGRIAPLVALGNAQCLPIRDSSVDLIVTSPPYASNAIDYMRAHKFSLVWLGHAVGDLSKRRTQYIGGEVVRTEDLLDLPGETAEVVRGIARLDGGKGRVLHRYYSEMARSLREMFRVLKPGKVAVVVVGASVMRGQNTEISRCLSEIAEAIGFEVPNIGVRNLDRDRRMMPVGNTLDRGSQIQQRMHEEYVIGLFKPARSREVCSNANR